LLRLGHLDLPATVDVGVMCCSPERAGLAATFRDFRIGPPISRDGLE
jgi:regulation of enolase protein 1 (concanavalin A-like superfamily)